jgi:Ser/Thr protein kinase RdoA (MazF antagonist)
MPVRRVGKKRVVIAVAQVHKEGRIRGDLHGSGLQYPQPAGEQSGEWLPAAHSAALKPLDESEQEVLQESL